MIAGTHSAPEWNSLPLRANSGGPSSRLRTGRVSASLLGDGAGRARCPRLYRLGLDFAGADPVESITRLLHAAGATDPESLRGNYAVPTHCLIASAQPQPVQRLDARTAPARDVLEQALLLGLCTNHVFDPSRPVLWTTTSLTRALELFDAAGFYV